MTGEPEGSTLDLAVRRLERAVALLESRTAAKAPSDGDAGGLFDQDRARLAAELDAARARERALEEAGAQASEALGRAIAEIRAALGDGDEDGGAPSSATGTEG